VRQRAEKVKNGLVFRAREGMEDQIGRKEPSVSCFMQRRGSCVDASTMVGHVEGKYNPPSRVLCEGGGVVFSE
jgi:hypothetical protein